MRIIIDLETDNAAFGGDEDIKDLREYVRDQEVTRILRQWATRISEDGYGAELYDINGNHVGTVTRTRAASRTRR